MDFQGRIVRYFVSKEESALLNNGQRHCPALVLTDWSPGTSELSEKSLNLKVMYDGTHTEWKTSSPHVDTHHIPKNQEQAEHEYAGCWEEIKE